jgi:hypothetical protein
MESSPFSHAAVAATWCRLLILFPKVLLVDLAIPTPNANGGFLLSPDASKLLAVYSIV